MSHRIITISREFGSGGRTIGKEVAKKLGLSCYDHNLIDTIAEKSGMSKEYIQELGEYTASPSFWGSALSGRDFYGHSYQDDLWLIQRKIILELAEKEPCVIVGRCADHILKNTSDLLTVFIHASMEKRIERITKIYGDSQEAPEKRLKDKDKKRKAYYQLYTDTEWGNVQNYHLALDSGVLGIETCVDIIAALY